MKVSTYKEFLDLKARLDDIQTQVGGLVTAVYELTQSIEIIKGEMAGLVDEVGTLTDQGDDRTKARAAGDKVKAQTKTLQGAIPPTPASRRRKS